MAENIFIPKKISVGFQERSDTYTQKLAYVIYYDEKNVLRKEKSWNGWRDKKIDPIDYDNAPTSGFVLNKKVGGYKSDWNFRNAYVRVYDPRGFEFEITIPNLLFILENTSSIKGKGLEGEFIYGWQGSDLYLIPTSCPNYVELTRLNDLKHSKSWIKSDQLILGATYRHKSNNSMVYIGRFDKFHFDSWRNAEKNGTNAGKHYYFKHASSTSIETYKSISGLFLEVLDPNCIGDYAEVIEQLEKSPIYSPIDHSRTEYKEYTLEEFKKNPGWRDCYTKVDNKWINYRISSWGPNKINVSSYDRRSWDQTFFSFEEIFNKYPPHYRLEYLLNGKFFRNSKIR